MPKKFLQRLMPDHRTIREHRHLRFLGTLLHDPNLWHLNRRSASGAFAVGLFVAWVPVPFQMLLGAIGAILFRVNLPLSAALVWVSNPLTMPPLFYFAYLVGGWLLSRQRSLLRSALGSGTLPAGTVESSTGLDEPSETPTGIFG